ncbi:MAG: hypothetical protein MUP85_07850 [Candidatus Lokiarchaeota archaeon]|nr:hypothetical protein [Candidatus Lokiarchaeota archaeon]
MKKIKITSILLMCTLILISIGNFTIAQDSSYVGISEGEEYTWDLGLNKDGINSLKDDYEILVQESLNDLLTIDLGAYTNLNVSEALLLAYDDYFELINDMFPPGLIPDDWKTVNISAFMENLFDTVIGTFNSSFLSGAIPSNWKSESIVNFFDHVIEGLNKTIPGFENFTLSEVLTTVINIINDNIPCELLPEGWEDMTFSNLIELYYGNYFNFINTTILPGMIPSGYLHMDLAQLLQNVFPILPQTLIDLFAASYDFSIFTLIEQSVQNLNISLMGGLIPGNWEDYTIPELVFPFLFQGYEDYNISYALDEFFEAINSTIPLDLYSVNMSSLINMTIYGITSGLSIEQQSAPTIDFLREGISMMIFAINSSSPVGTFPEDWMSLSIDNLRSYYVNQAQVLFDQFMVQVEGLLYQFEIFGGFQKISLKAIIDHIGVEKELYSGGPKGVPINITIQIKVPMSDWINLTDLIGFDIFQYYPIYILDPTTFSVDEGALIEQFLSTGGLFIGNNYDWSSIVTEYEFPGPDPDKSFNFNMDWNTNGVLDHIRLEYDGQEVASIELQTPTEPGIISGYNLLIFIGITLFSMGALISSIKKKKTKF